MWREGFWTVAATAWGFLACGEGRIVMPDVLANAQVNLRANHIKRAKRAIHRSLVKFNYRYAAGASD